MIAHKKNRCNPVMTNLQMSQLPAGCGTYGSRCCTSVPDVDKKPAEEEAKPKKGAGQITVSDMGPILDRLWAYQCPLTKGRNVSCMAWNRTNPVGDGMLRLQAMLPLCHCCDLTCTWTPLGLPMAVWESVILVFIPMLLLLSRTCSRSGMVSLSSPSRSLVWCVAGH